MDALSDVLRVTRLVGGVFLHAEFTEPWCLFASPGPEVCGPIEPRPTHVILYHYVVQGTLRVRIGEDAPVTLEAGEAVLLPRNDPHRMGGDFSLPAVPVGEVVHLPDDGGLMTIRHGGGGARTEVVCGFLGCDNHAGNPLLAALPPLLRLDVRRDPAADWIHATFRFAADEMAAGTAGSDTMLAKVSELLLVQAVRFYVAALPPEQTGWLAGLRDPYVSRALGLMHERVEAAWAVEDLARAVGLSRSALADRFTQLVGEPPMQYLARWRMHVAAHRLRTSRTPMIRIAEGVGYESEAAFSRAFKRVFGTPPAAWRKGAAGSGSDG